jgi:hypothetical protein
MTESLDNSSAEAWDMKGTDGTLTTALAHTRAHYPMKVMEHRKVDDR